jgi:ribosomal protein S16
MCDPGFDAGYMQAVQDVMNLHHDPLAADLIRISAVDPDEVKTWLRCSALPDERVERVLERAYSEGS